MNNNENYLLEKYKLLFEIKNQEVESTWLLRVIIFFAVVCITFTIGLMIYTVQQLVSYQSTTTIYQAVPADRGQPSQVPVKPTNYRSTSEPESV